MTNLKHRLQTLLHNNKKLKQIIIGVVILLSIPLTVFLVMNRQSLWSKAGPGNADLSITPSSKTHNVGETGSLDVFLNPEGEDVSGVEVVLTYNPSVITVTSVAPGAFFTDEAPTVGNPIEIIKSINAGQIHYALAFPLGSNHSSTASKIAIKVNYTVIAAGTSAISFATAGNPKTTISDIAAQNVLGDVFGGTINVGSGPRLYFSAPTPANPQTVNGTFTLDILADTGGQDSDGIDAKIGFDPLVLKVTSLVKGTEPTLPLYQALSFDNTLGTVTISANIGSAIPAIPANGSALKVATITFQALSVSSNTPINFDFTLGSRNDSNIVLSGTSQSGDPQDILASVTNASISINGGSGTPTPTTAPTATPTSVPTATPTPVPSATITPTPIAINTPTPQPTATIPPNTPTPTSSPAKTVTLNLLFQGTTRPDSGFPKVLSLLYKTVSSPTTLGPISINLSSTGQGLFSVIPGNYIVKVKAPGYLARVFGTPSSPTIITSTSTTLDFTTKPLLGGDFNGDGVINEVDYTAQFLPNFLQANTLIDLDGSGQVNNLDFGIMRSNWSLTDEIL